MRRPALTLMLTLAACSSDPVVFYNPKNGAITECVPVDVDPFLDQCIATYQRAGWVRLTDPVINRENPPTSTSP